MFSVYWFDINALKFVFDNWQNRKRRTKTENVYSASQKILFGVPQGSVLVPLLFNTDICDLFLIIKDYNIANYADDNTPYETRKM